jgi:diguanylate cyclase (GGDEF)-like protein
VGIVLIAAIAGLAALALVAVAGWLAVGARRSSVEVADAVSGLNKRMEVMVQELADARARADESERQQQFLGELAGSIDLDEVLGRTLEAAGALPGADAVVACVSGPESAPVTAALGVEPQEAEKHKISGPPDGRPVRAIEVSYSYKGDEPGAMRAGVAVPLHGDADDVGTIALYSRNPGHAFPSEVVDELELLALRAGPAIENARRFREARQLADLDALTQLHNRRYFHETLAREVARAHRYDRKLALIVFDLDDFKAINDRIGHLSGDAVLAEVAERVREVVRAADVACRVGGDEFAIILPESALVDAGQLYDRLQAAIGSRPLGQAGRLQVSAGVAEIKPEDDAVSFFERADEALYRAKDAGKAQVVSATNRFGNAS